MFPSEKITEAIVKRECSSYGGGGEDIVSLINIPIIMDKKYKICNH